MKPQPCCIFSLVLLLGVPPSVDATITVHPWTRLYRGVDFTRGISEVADGRPQLVSALRVDLTEPTLHFTSMPSNGPAPLDVVSQTASQFLTSTGTQVAVNTSFYTPCCTGLPQNKDIVGLAVTDEQLISPAESAARAALLIDLQNRAAFVNTVSDPYTLAGVDTAFAGSNFLLGIDRDLPTSPDTIHPARTLVGLGDRDVAGDNALLYVLTVDAGIAGSDGATRRESAEWLMRFGAHTGVNLDGGGSTIMVARDPISGQIDRLNASPFAERSSANFLGISAEPAVANPPRTFAPLWFAGLPDNSVSDFSPEDGSSNPLPGSPEALDDDYYFAGEYPDPIGIVARDEPLSNLERAVIAFDPPNDRELRFHFHLSPTQASDGTEFRFLTSVFQQDGAGGRSVDLELLMNGNLVETIRLSEGAFYMSPTFTAAGAGAQTGANRFTIRQIGGDAQWTSFDFHRLDIKTVPEPIGRLLELVIASVVIGYRRQQLAST